MSDSNDATTTTPYKERDDFVPDNSAYIGTVDTTGTGGDLAAQVMQSSPVHEQLRAEALRRAAEDPSDSNVILPDDDLDRDGAISLLEDAAKNAAEVVDARNEDGYLTPAQREAAMEGTPVNPNSPEAHRSDTLSVDESDGYGAREIDPTNQTDGGGLRQDEQANPNARQPVDPNADTSGDEGSSNSFLGVDTTSGGGEGTGSGSGLFASSSDTAGSATVVNDDDKKDGSEETSQADKDAAAKANRPHNNAGETKWVDWAVDYKGLTRAEAQALGKSELQKL